MCAVFASRLATARNRAGRSSSWSPLGFDPGRRRRMYRTPVVAEAPRALLDPYLARLSVASVLIAMPSLLVRRLAPARPILLALAAVAATHTPLSAGPQICGAAVAQAAGRLVSALVAWRTVEPAMRPSLRMGRIGLGGLATGVI